MTRPSNRSQERKHELTVGSRTLRNSNSSSLVFLNSHGGKTQRNEDDNGESKTLKREVPIDRKEKKYGQLERKHMNAQKFSKILIINYLLLIYILFITKYINFYDTKSELNYFILN